MSDYSIITQLYTHKVFSREGCSLIDLIVKYIVQLFQLVVTILCILWHKFSIFEILVL